MAWHVWVEQPGWDAERTAVSGGIPPREAKRLANLLRDSKTVIAVGLFPLLGLLLIPRLIQWYRLAARYPGLVWSSDPPWGSDAGRLASEFREAKPRFWFAILFWPAFALIAFVSVAWVTR